MTLANQINALNKKICALVTERDVLQNAVCSHENTRVLSTVDTTPLHLLYGGSFVNPQSKRIYTTMYECTECKKIIRKKNEPQTREENKGENT